MAEELKIKITADTGDAEQNIKGVKDEVEDLGDKGSSTGEKLKTAFSAIGSTLDAAFKTVGATLAGAATGLTTLAETTREYRTEQAKLEAAFTSAGGSAETATATYNDLYRVLGDGGQATEAANHLAQLTTNQQDLSEWTDICQGVYATFGDSLPIESLTEAANETAKTGELTGGLADALNWAGQSEEEFQAKLDACNTEAEREQLIRETLNGVYSDAAAAYEESAGAIMDANMAQAKLTEAMGALGGAAEPVVTLFKSTLATALTDVLPHLDGVSQGLQDIINGVDGGEEKLAEGVTGMMNSITNSITELLPNLITTGVTIVTSLLEGILQALPGLITAIAEAIPPLLQGIVDAFVLIVEYLPGIIEAIVQALPTLVPALIDGVVQMVVSLCQNFASIIQPIIDALPDIIVSIVEALVNNLPALIEGIIELVLGIVAAIPQIIQGLVDALPTVISLLIEAVLGNLPAIISGLIEVVLGIVKALPQIFGSLIEAVPAALQGIWDGIGNIFGNIGSWFGEKFGEAKEAVVGKVTEMKEKAVEKYNEIKDKASEKFEEMKSKVSEKVGAAKEAVSTKFEEIKSNISDKLATAKETVTTKFEEIKGNIGDKLANAKETVTSKFEEIKNKMGEKLEEAKNSKIGQKLSDIKDAFSSKLGDSLSTVKSKFTDIASNIGTKIGEAKDKVKGAIDAIKGFFNFKFEWPKLSMPKFSITPQGWKVGDLLKGSIPKLSISWNALGGIFDKPTVFGYGSSLQGIGEDGAEAVVPLEKNTQWLDKIAAMLNEKMGGNTPIILQVDGKTFAQISVDSINQLTKQTGSLPLVIA